MTRPTRTAPSLRLALERARQVERRRRLAQQAQEPDPNQLALDLEAPAESELPITPEQEAVFD